MFYLNTIEQLFLFVEQLDQLKVCLPYSRLLIGIPILAVFQNFRWNSNKTVYSAYSNNISESLKDTCCVDRSFSPYENISNYHHWWPLLVNFLRITFHIFIKLQYSLIIIPLFLFTPKCSQIISYLTGLVESFAKKIIMIFPFGKFDLCSVGHVHIRV